jgi:putative transposase
LSTPLSQWIGCQRFVFNAKVAEDRYFRTFRNHSLSLTGLHTPTDQQYSQFKDKDLTPFLYDVPSQILRNGAYRYMQGYSRFRQGLSGRPTRKKKHGRQTVMITKELFRFIPIGKITKSKDGDIIEHKLFIGTEKSPIGELKFKAHRPYGIPNSITVSRHNEQWHVSFNYAVVNLSDNLEPMTEEKLIEYFSCLTAEELDAIAVGGDRGVTIPMATSDGVNYDFSETEKKRLIKAKKQRKKLQKRLAKQQKESNRRKVTKGKIGKTYTKERNIRQDCAHKISHAIVESEAKVFVHEDLPVKNMTKRVKPKHDVSGKYVKNGAAAKSGLNGAILRSMWGMVIVFIRYKGLKKEKLTIKIPPHGTSQECSRCGHTHPDNRETQAEFICQDCGFTANADYNAALVIKKRGIKALLDGTIVLKQKKTVRVRKESQPQIGQGLPESRHVSMDVSRIMGGLVVHGQEATVRRAAGITRSTRVSVNREAPTLTVSCG